MPSAGPAALISHTPACREVYALHTPSLLENTPNAVWASAGAAEGDTDRRRRRVTARPLEEEGAAAGTVRRADAFAVVDELGDRHHRDPVLGREHFEVRITRLDRMRIGDAVAMIGQQVIGKPQLEVDVGSLMDRVTAVRTVNHAVIDEHAAATNWMHVGRPVSGTVIYPSYASIIAHERGPLA